jgi:serine/threonine-protein kinase
MAPVTRLKPKKAEHTLTDNQRILADRYQVGSLIGRGGMADVYEGLDTRLGRKVAIKLLKSDLANDPTFESRFRQEAQASARMAHPTIVRVYDAGEEISTDSNGNERKTPYIVMEYVRGTLLRDLLHERKLGIPESIGYAEGVLTALEFSHLAGVIHRDIKAANVMITDTGLVKVMDFGIARAVSESSITQAHTNGIVGTAQYFSPEQARGENVDARTDLYSTGVLLYEMLAGRPPFTGETAVSVAYQHVSEAVVAPSEHNPMISAELDQVVLRALAKDRNDRFQSAEEFRDHLLAASLEVATPPVSDVFEGAPTPAHELTPEAAAVLSDLDEFESIIAGALGEGTEAVELVSDSTDELAPEPTVSAPAPATTEYNAPIAPTEVLSTNSDPFKSLGVSFDDTGSQPVATETDRRPFKNPGLVWGIGSGAVVFVIGLIAWLLTSSLPNIQPTNGSVSVSAVAGLSYENAQSQLVAQKLLVQKAYEVSDTVAVDTVIRTDPTAGSMVGANTLITVYVSTGKTQVSMPDLSGMNEQMAKDAIEQAKLTLGTIVQAHSATIPKGQVIESDPVSGTKLAQGAIVNLTISDGLVEVPDVRNYSLTEARAALAASGLLIVIGTNEECVGTPQGTTVVDQSILPGTATPGSSITLFVTCAP